MRITPTALPEVLLIEPTVHRDDRGFFLETWHAEKYASAGLAARFVQDNHSRSCRGTLRGLHAQLSRAPTTCRRRATARAGPPTSSRRSRAPTAG